MGDDGGLFWVLIAVVGAMALGGALARSMARERDLETTDRETEGEQNRRVYAEEARDGAR